MIFFNWVTVNWLVWMPIQIIIIIILIFILRLLRRRHRWGPIEVSHVHEEYWHFQDQKIPCYVKSSPNREKTSQVTAKNVPYRPINQNSCPKILFFPPIFAKTQQKYYLSMSLALLGFDVITISADQLCKLFPNAHGSSKTFQTILQELKISKVIAFDYAISPIMQIYSNISTLEREKLKLKWIFIRPTLNWNFIQPSNHLLPFTYPWISRKKLSKYSSWYFSLFPLNSKLNISVDMQSLPSPTLFKDSIRFINPSFTWISPKFLKVQQDWMEQTLTVPNIQCITFTKGNWCFFRNETVVLGYIAQFLYEV
ncbi:hypothetical protein NEF87_002279 [Candidatus Lokiarchaeum ossiferum]|uniref:Uncharacterized protein n=1 Tax=Candidatus Lokiarchaeum ossiferum TaxID=2951803 RepID=A0ABY6HTX5_9ARCH|nr:hypothetical protein NEF87_002279 [Candidatus Lokiarchaeum sp. B-35]